MSGIKTLKFSSLLFVYATLSLVMSYALFKVEGCYVLEFELFNLGSIPFTFSMVVDKVSVSFSGVVTIISGSVFFFSSKYMGEDPFSNRFIWILLLFVLSMNFLIFSGSVFFLLVGWDGLGITSFALIIYYESKESLMAGFQTLLINRLGDVVIVLSIFMFCSSGQFSMYFYSDKIFYLSGLVCLLCVAALTKSAQFPFSSWLPAAMAAPTPVSALVHSSTLVTAGIFIIIRLSWSMSLSPSVSSMLLFCGSVTCLLGGWAATYENDIKKVIALSTLSQLGVMVFSLGMNFPSLGLFHLYTHAMFKALLFLAAGHILMMTFGNQDVRSMGGVGLSMPFTAVMFTISSLCLVGAPFVSAFYSKHLILELMLANPFNVASVAIMFLATMMTAKYVFRTLKGVVWASSGNSILSGCSDIFTFVPLLILSSGAIMGGSFFSNLDLTAVEFVYIPWTWGLLINLVTTLGVVLGLTVSGFQLSSFSLSTLFYLTPLVYGSTKVFSLVMKTLGVLDQGWMEPYFIIKNRAYWGGSKISEQGYWPSSRVILSALAVSMFFFVGFMFTY